MIFLMLYQVVTDKGNVLLLWRQFYEMLFQEWWIHYETCTSGYENTDIQCPAHSPATNFCFNLSLYLLTEPGTMQRFAINHWLSVIKFCKHRKLKPKPPFTYVQFAVSMRLFRFRLHCTDPGTETLPILLALHSGMCRLHGITCQPWRSTADITEHISSPISDDYLHT